MTRAQARALVAVNADFVDVAIEPDGQRPLGVEIGFGMGHGLLHWAEQAPDWQLYGIELYQPGIGALLDGMVKGKVDNVRVLEQPAQIVFARLLENKPASIDEVRIQFPDPWPKKRHHKRRLIQDAFIETLAGVLKPGGVVKLVTDWAPYALWIKDHFDGHRTFARVHESSGALHETNLGAIHDDDERVTTKFERRGDRLGHQIHELHYQVRSP